MSLKDGANPRGGQIMGATAEWGSHLFAKAIGAFSNTLRHLDMSLIQTRQVTNHD